MGCQAVPLAELRTIAALCRSKGVRLHMDGARLWEVMPHYAAQIEGGEADYSAVCALFDSVYVSFYKGVGALASAMLCGPEQLVADTKAWIARRGAKNFTVGPMALSAELALEQALPTFALRYERLGHP